jgi:hypothetical protein
MSGLAHWKAEQARVWGSAAWQPIAESVLSKVHEQLVARLARHPGDCWLDVASGTEAVALRAARAGAEVSALDLAPALVRRRLFIGSDGPGRTRVAALPPAERKALRLDLVDYFERHRCDGRVCVPRPYLLMLGRRRGWGRR